MSLISPGGENLLDFLELWQVFLTYDGDLRTPSGGLRKGQSPCKLLGGLSGFLSHRCRGLRLCWSRCRNLRFPNSADMNLGVLLKSPQGSQSSSRVGACTCTFLPSCSSSVTLLGDWIMVSVPFPEGFPLRLFHEAFPQGYPTCHRGVSRSSA